jgi:hypothetical protein
MNKGVLITAGLVTAIAVIAAVVTASTTIEENPFRDAKLLQRGMGLPVIWLYLDSSDVTSRSWLDFMGRSSRAIRLPFMNLCYQTIVVQNKDNYRVEVINGLSDVAIRLGGWAALPTTLQNPLATVGEAELGWIRAAILKKEGGLWLSPTVVAIKPFDKMPSDKVVFFGTDTGETFSGPAGTPAPGLRCVWSPRAEHPMFVKWEAMTRNRLETQMGGKEFRGDEKWDARQLAAEFSKEVEYKPHEELSRKPSGKRIQLEDLLSAGQQGVLPFDIQKQSTYVPIPWSELERSRNFGWFLRMSEEQIMESDLVITDMFKISIHA